MREYSELQRALRSDVENTAEAVRPSCKARMAANRIQAETGMSDMTL
jgi:hypothetical protein